VITPTRVTSWASRTHRSGRPTAAACYAAAGRLGLRVGTDVAVTGFDGGTVSRLLAPALTTVAMPLARIANRLVDRVIAAAAGTPDGGGEVVDTTLVRGGSA
jgi:DNA-binding LacI/PurR family transcriptional regulator